METTIPGRVSAPSCWRTHSAIDLGGALGEVEEELATFAEDAAQEAWHREDDMPMRKGRGHLLL